MMQKITQDYLGIGQKRLQKITKDHLRIVQVASKIIEDNLRNWRKMLKKSKYHLWLHKTAEHLKSFQNIAKITMITLGLPMLSQKCQNHLGIAKDVVKITKKHGIAIRVAKESQKMDWVLSNKLQKISKMTLGLQKPQKISHLRCHLPLLAGRSVGWHHVFSQQVIFLRAGKRCLKLNRFSCPVLYSMHIK
jgi:hypothetical protein